MNQKIVFYLISIVLVFFIGYSYSQFNAEKPEPIIITVDNSNEIDEYKSDISNLESQLEELDSQLISTLDELKRTSKKLILSSSKVKVLEDQIFSIQQRHDEIETKLIQSDSINSANEKEIKSLRDELANTLIELELSQFELELLEEQL